VPSLQWLIPTSWSVATTTSEGWRGAFRFINSWGTRQASTLFTWTRSAPENAYLENIGKLTGCATLIESEEAQYEWVFDASSAWKSSSRYTKRRSRITSWLITETSHIAQVYKVLMAPRLTHEYRRHDTASPSKMQACVLGFWNVNNIIASEQLRHHWQV
jgi:hypothetical protein